MEFLPNELIVNFCQFLDSFDLIQFSSTNSRYRDLITGMNWNIICQVKYACMPIEKPNLGFFSSLCWPIFYDNINSESTLELLFSKFKFKKFDLSNLNLENIRLFNDAEYLDLTGNHSLRINSLKDVKCNKIILPSGEYIDYYIIKPADSFFLNSIIRNDIVLNNNDSFVVFESCLLQAKVIKPRYHPLSVVMIKKCYFSEDTFEGISVEMIHLEKGFITFELLHQFKLCSIIFIKNIQCTVSDYLKIKKHFKFLTVTMTTNPKNDILEINRIIIYFLH